jgi:hypothetical protein
MLRPVGLLARDTAIRHLEARKIGSSQSALGNMKEASLRTYQTTGRATLELRDITLSYPTSLDFVAAVLEDNCLGVWVAVNPFPDVLLHPQVLSYPKVVVGFFR